MNISRDAAPGRVFGPARRAIAPYRAPTLADRPSAKRLAYLALVSQARAPSTPDPEPPIRRGRIAP